MKFFANLILISCLPYWIIAQTYPDHYGIGQYQGVTVTSSNEGTGTTQNLALNRPASQSSDFNANNFFPSYANDGDISTMNHTVNSSSWYNGTPDIRNLALRKPTSQSSIYSGGAFPVSKANDGDLNTMNHTAAPSDWGSYNATYLPNLALNRPATQSSDLNSTSLASNANDSNTRTISHTIDSLQAWWEVDLETINNLKQIKIVNQQYNAHYYLDSFYVFVSDVPFSSNDPDVLAAQAAVGSYFFESLSSVHIMDIERAGRYVRIQLVGEGTLQLREVSIFGLPQNTSWWEVDLGAISNITDIEVYNRTDCCSDRLDNSYVFVSDTPFTSDDVDETLAQTGVSNYFTATAPDINTISVNRTGRYVRIQLTEEEALHLNEVKVFGVPKVTSWWEVDLGTIGDITDIEVFNRTSCCGDRLDNFYVLVSDTPFASENLENAISKTNVSSYFTATAQDVNTIAVNRTGRYVRVQLAEDNALHLNEVRVLGTQKENLAINTVNGTGILPDLADASRFLAQATLGYNYEEIEKVSQMGIDEWLDEQFNLPYSSYEESYRIVYDSVVGLAYEEPGRRKREFLSYAFYQKLTTDKDFLRHKSAFALSQILVISNDDPTLQDAATGTADYYDILYQNAFGNFRDILSEVSVHTAMGVYLSSFQNTKADFGLRIFPDENYAREVMQLFTIGLWELNNDGTPKIDSNGNQIPTYDNEDIQELAKVFTGMATGVRTNGNSPSFTLGLANAGQIEFAAPMKMYEEHHDKQEKIMIDGSIIPAGQDGLQDIEDALDVLFNHPNVGPFISKRMIQQLVKSNPSPAYVNRVSNAFNNNGLGVKGDLQAVVKAILTDPEARTCDFDTDLKAGKLKQPVERITNLFLAFDISSPSGKMWYKDQANAGTIEQEFLGSPSVFNFFSPFYAEKNHVEPNDMVSPEFQILSSTSSIYYLNLIEEAIKNKPFDNYTRLSNNRVMAANSADAPSLDFSDEIHIMETEGIDALLDRLDILLCQGQLSIETRNVIKDGITQYQANVPDYNSSDAVKDAIYFIMISSDFIILK